MIKKILGLGMVLALLFILAACNTTPFDLAGYKIEAKTEIVNYVTESNYSTENWIIVCGIVATGKKAIDAAENKADVDTAVTTAKSAIGEVEMKIIKEKIYESWWDGKVEITVIFPEPVKQGEIFEINVVTKNLLNENLIRELSSGYGKGRGVLITAIKLQSDSNYGIYHHSFHIQDGAVATDIILVGEQAEAVWIFEGEACNNNGYILGVAKKGTYDVYFSDGYVYKNALTIT